MNKKISLIFAILITCIIANLIYLSDKPIPKEEITIQRVIDGDTFQSTEGKTYRLVNINSPEKSNPLYQKSFLFLKDYEGHSVKIVSIGEDIYGRRLAKLYSPNNTYLNLESVKLGLSSKFLVQEKELKTFSKAEDFAIKNQKGIWNHSKFYGCFSAKIDYEKEIVLLKSTCNVNLANFSLKDESRKEYFFKNISFSNIYIHSYKGIDNSTDIFWNSKENIWNNDRDTLYLFDNQGKIVLSYHYGY